MNIEQRNDAIRKLMVDAFSEVESKKTRLSKEIETCFDTIFKSSATGFREILLVIVLAKLFDSSYIPSMAFYNCNPRAIYEGPIRNELAARKIPRGKSGPLNVAKAAIGINKQWGAQRRPKEVADCIVRLVKEIERMKKDELWIFSLGLHHRFLDLRDKVAKLGYVPSSHYPRQDIIWASIDLIKKTPDYGNTPQRICGEILQQTARYYSHQIALLGVSDRASTASTTSHKPGDITEFLNSNQKPIRVFEISVKVVNEQRLDDCVESIAAYCQKNACEINEILFLCRREDVQLKNFVKSKEPSIFFGEFLHGGITFVFVDIFGWIEAQLSTMPQNALDNYFNALNSYIQDENTSEKVKLCWVEYFAPASNREMV